MLVFELNYDGWMAELAKRNKRGFNNAQKAAYRVAGIYWHREFRPKHFTRKGASEYRYTPRKGERQAPGSKGFRRSYTGRKLKTFGHTRPLVFTGASEKLSQICRVQATSKRVRVPIYAPALNFRQAHSRVDMKAEMEEVTPREEQILIQRLFRKALEREIKKVRTQVKKQL